VLPYVGDEEFCFTYGDGLTDLNLTEVIEFHRQQGRLATVTAVQPPGRFGALETKGDRVDAFVEKPHGDGSWINGGFFVLSPEVGDYIEGETTVWEQEPLERLAREGQLSAYRYGGFWQMMDTLRDRNLLEDLWTSGKAPWRTWE
jgi:glucose-1-phosphate cytidylyltransferase